MIHSTGHKTFYLRSPRNIKIKFQLLYPSFLISRADNYIKLDTVIRAATDIKDNYYGFGISILGFGFALEGFKDLNK